MERKAYPVDEKLFYLLVEENFEKLNIDELQRLFDNSSHEISNKWVFTNEKIKGFFWHHGLYGYKYFNLIDYGNNSTYEVGIPDISKSDNVIERQKCIVIDEVNQPARMIPIKRYIFDRLASGTQIINYLVKNKKQVLIKSFIDFFHDEVGKIQDRVEQNDGPTEHKNPLFVTYYVDPKQFQDHKNVVSEKFQILKDITDINIKEVFFKPYTDKDIIALINIQTKTMDLVKAINEYMRADASLYLEWRDSVFYNRFDSQMLSQYKQEEADKDNIKNVEQTISSELRDFSDDWYDNESLILSSKNNFYFRSRQLIDKIRNLLRNFTSFIFNNILKLCWEKLRRCYNRTWSYIKRNKWIQIVMGWTAFALFSGLCQALFQKYLINN